MSPYCKEDKAEVIQNDEKRAKEEAEKKKNGGKKEEGKKEEKKEEKKSGLAQSSDYDIQNPTLKVKDAPSPVKTSIKGKGCTAEPCPVPRAPCCKVAAEPVAKKEEKKAASLA